MKRSKVQLSALWMRKQTGAKRLSGMFKVTSSFGGWQDRTPWTP